MLTGWRLIAPMVLGAFVCRMEAAQCGTAILFEPGKRLNRLGLKSGSLMLGAATDNRARTLETAHFFIHYSLHGLHKVRTGPEDADLMHATDSLYAVLAALPPASRDSAVYARLDASTMPHPAFVQKVAQYFEAARTYYVDKLGMRAPLATIASVQYNVPFTSIRKFPVDLVDVGTADAQFFGETYAVTYPPQSLSITFENDFLWDTSLDPDGNIVGQSIKSQVAGQVLHDYAEEWELGIKVTAFHEFYHAVQFTYNPDVQNYHAWYEISAVGMEERNAPEVNDYFQYLPCVLKNHDRVPLTSLAQGPCTHSPVYGNGIFHVYLSAKLDSVFDAKVWNELSHNGDVLKTALETVFLTYGQTMDPLYSDYASQLLFSGRLFHPPVTGLFSPDIPSWTTVSTDSLDMSEAVPYRLIKVPALTFSVLKVSWGQGSILKTLLAKGVKGITRIHANADTSIVESISDAQFNLGPPLPGFQEYYLVIPNASFSTAGSVEISEVESGFYAFPNPVHSQAPAALYFAQAKGMTFPARVEIFGENGVLVKSLSYAASKGTLTWDLKDDDSRTVRPGIYYYRLEKETLRPLVILR